MIDSLSHKGLEELYETGKTRRIDQRLHKRIIRRLDALAASSKAEDMNIPGFDFHGLQGFTPKRYTVHINGPWCITFKWQEQPQNIDFVQYH